MFDNTTIDITRSNNDYTTTPLYTGISAQVYKNLIASTSNTGEYTNRERTIVLLDKQYNGVKEGDNITYTDEFGISRKVSIHGMQYIGLGDGFLELTCEKV